MAGDHNGHGSPSRLDRIERAIEALIDGHERLLTSQKQLLTSQVLLTDTVNELGKKIDQLTVRVDDLTKKIDSREDRIQILVDSQLRVDATLVYFRNLIERRPSQS